MFQRSYNRPSCQLSASASWEWGGGGSIAFSSSGTIGETGEEMPEISTQRQLLICLRVAGFLECLRWGAGHFILWEQQVSTGGAGP